jgi:hypothetical protein
MNDDAFADLERALKDALAFELGERRELKRTRIQASGPSKLIDKHIACKR